MTEDALNREIASAVAQGFTVKYRDTERAVIELRSRGGWFGLTLGTLAALLIGGFIASAGGVGPLIGLVVMVAGLIYTWSPTTDRWELWVEGGQVLQRKAR